LVSVHGTAHRHDYYDRHEDALFLAENAVHVLARNGRSWRRLKHLVDLALRSSGSNNTDTDTDTDTDTASSSSSNNNNLVQKSVADIGTDHGLLAAALALSGRFKSVLGVDASDKALQEGALALHAEIIEYRSRQQQPEQSQTTSMSSVPLSTPPLSQLEFRHGDGLQVVRPGEADIVCIAGMGVHTMLHILSGTKSSTERETLATLDYLACQQLILQPTNSRPRNLMMLYTGLRDRGWHVNDERIEYLSSRWYFSTSFVRSSQETHNGNDAGPLPGFKLLDQDKDSDIFRNYVEHHCSWLREDKQAAGNLRGGEEEWLEAFDNTTGTTTY
jgi:tRNA A22 N-methylase